MLASLQAVEVAIRSLNLYTGALEDPVGRAYTELVHALMGYDAPASIEPQSEVTPTSTHTGALPRPSTLYRRLYALLAEETGISHPDFGDAWRNHLLNRILADENPFSRRAEATTYVNIGHSMRDAAAHDLKMLQVLYGFAEQQIIEAVKQRELDANHLPSFHDFEAKGETGLHSGDEGELKTRFVKEEAWETLLPHLSGFIQRRGLGIFRGHTAFRWEHDGREGRLVGIAAPDPIHLDDLFAYEKEQELILRNTEHFVAGYPSNNVLLYGDRGTGKSSTVKALLHAYSDRGLRMVEVQKERLGDFPQITRLLRGRRERFVIFIDDLSFEEHETHYKDLKALLEGSLEARPDNLILYATSNRRHLIKERHSDRIHPLEDDEIHLNDTTEEKLSLSDRFGLTLTFVSPTQERYLQIVRGIAERRGIGLPGEELRARALAWATQRGSRSGRVARQFIDFLAGELKIGQIHS